VYGWARRFADVFGWALDASGHNLGQEHALDQLKADPRRFILLGTGWLAPDTGVRLIPLTPVPCFLWSLIWPWDNQHPLLAQLVELAAKAAQPRAGWPTIPATTGCPAPTAPTCQTPDGRQRDQVKLPGFCRLLSWLVVSGGDSLFPDAAEGQGQAPSATGVSAAVLTPPLHGVC
jgi:hypothetical protein